MSAFTPGPWFTDDKTSSDLYRYVMSDKYPNTVCKIGLRGDKHAEANARLIAAAPALLEALQEADRLYSTYGLLCKHEDCGPWINAARAAIAKATGSAT